MSYCTRCGFKEVSVPTGRFNKDTGEPIFYERCLNKKCQKGCEHRRWSFWGNSCKDCGYVQQDY